MLDTKDLIGGRTRRGYNMGTASGKPFWPLDPQPEDVRIEDIASHLARICRFNGALRDCVGHYSVAQHSVLVSLNVPPAYAFEGLMHDAAEAYTGDMIKPLKEALPDHEALSARIEDVIREKYGLPRYKSAPVREADYRAVLTERRDLLPENFDVDWGAARAEPWPEKIVWVGSRLARAMFLDRFYELTKGAL